MERDSKIYVAGHKGLVGSAIVRCLQSQGYRNLVLRTHQELDLEVQKDVNDFFERERPEYVFLATAKVGGIYANNTYPADFIYNNLIIEVNVIHAAYRYGVKKLLFLGSSCIYPRLAPQPMKEEYLLSGPLEPTNEPYAIAKIAGIKLCQSYNRQYRTNFISVMPTNLYGPNDNYDLMDSHVLPALIRRFRLAKLLSEGNYDEIVKDFRIHGNMPEFLMSNVNYSADSGCLLPTAYSSAIPADCLLPTAYSPTITADCLLPSAYSSAIPADCLLPTAYSAIVNHLSNFGIKLTVPSTLSLTSTFNVFVEAWGTGVPRREFMYSDDMTDACVFIMNLDKEVLPSTSASSIPSALDPRASIINIGTGEDITIQDLTQIVAEVVGYKGEIRWDATKPDGTPRRMADWGFGLIRL